MLLRERRTQGYLHLQGLGVAFCLDCAEFLRQVQKDICVVETSKYVEVIPTAKRLGTLHDGRHFSDQPVVHATGETAMQLCVALSDSVMTEHPDNKRDEYVIAPSLLQMWKRWPLRR